MKMAFLCPYSHPSACGVWNRVYNEAKELVKRGHDVYVFSSNIIKGTGKKSSDFEIYEGIKIYRFPARISFGNGIFFNFKKELLKIKPEIISAHVYRHPHSTLVLKPAKKIGAKCFLVTHAPFVEKGLRGFKLNFLTKLYDKFLGKNILNSYTKVIAIAKWEIPILLKLGCRKDKIIHLCNGIPKEILKIPLVDRKPKNILFLGRIAPVKNLEIVLKIASRFKELNFKIIGPVEQGYKLNSNLKNVEIINKTFNLKEEIDYLKKSDIFILPSKREAIPIVLLEAMGAGKIAISSNTQGGKELISRERGFIFNSEEELIEILHGCVKNYKNIMSIRKNARRFAEKLTWDKIVNRLEGLYR